jgi:4-hydroxy-4-methyl-2-oxoglutarate aldolase
MSYSLSEIRSHLYAAVLCDALDQVGLRHQSPRVDLSLVAGPKRWQGNLAGRCKTTLWVDMYHDDPRPYELELQAVDACQADDVIIAAAGGSMRSGVWGELLTTAAIHRGCIGAIVDGAIRDTRQISEIGFPVLARGTCLYDSLHRQRVVDVDVPVEIDAVRFEPGDLVFADADGIVVVPRQVEAEVLRLAFEKVGAENLVRRAIAEGMSAVAAFERFGVL